MALHILVPFERDESYVDLDKFEEGTFRSRDIRIIDFSRSNIKIDKKLIFLKKIAFKRLEVPKKSILCPIGPINYERVKGVKIYIFRHFEFMDFTKYL